MELYSPEFNRKVEQIKEDFSRRAMRGPDKVFLDPIELIPTEVGVMSAAAKGNWAHGFYGLTEEVEKEIKKRADRKVLVVVFDTAARFDHPSLKDFAWNELSRDFVGVDGDPDDGHALHVATDIAGIHPGGLKLGIATVLGGKLKIAAAKCLRDAGWGYLNDIIEATKYYNSTVAPMITDGWFVIYNFSLGSPGINKEFKEVLEEAENLGVYISAAAGNNGKPILAFPGAYTSTHGIGSIDPDGKRSSFSDYGGSLYRVAPGSRIFGAYRDGYYELSGTSMACPTDVGAVAIWASISPKATARQISHAGRYWAVDMASPGWDDQTGAGHANFYAILNEDPTRFPDKENGNPETPNYEPAPVEEEPTRNLRNVEFKLGEVQSIRWKGFGDGDFTETPLHLAGTFRTDMDASDVHQIVRLQAAKFFSQHYIVIPAGSDLADAGWWAIRWFSLELRKQGLNISIDQRNYWVEDKYGYKMRVTGPPTTPRGKSQGVYLGSIGRDNKKKSKKK